MIFSDSSPHVAWPSTWTTLVVSVTLKTVGAVSSHRSHTMQPGMIQTFVTVPLSPVGASMPAMPDSTPAGRVAVAAAAGAGAAAGAAGAGAAGFGAGFAGAFAIGFAFGLVTRFSGRHQSMICGSRV